MDKRYDKEYQGRLERNWKCQKREQAKKRRILKTIEEKEEEIKQEDSGVREQTKENKDKMNNMVDPYYKL